MTRSTITQGIGDVVLPGPLAPFVERIAADLAAAGFSKSTCDVFARAIRHFDKWLLHENVTLEMVDERIIERHHLYRRQLALGPHGADAALQRLLLLLREWQVCPPRQHVPLSAIESQLAEFGGYLVTQRGLASSTVRLRVAVARRFLQSHPLHSDDGTSINIAVAVSAFIRHEIQGHGPPTARQLAAGLRALLRFLAFRGQIESKTIDCVPAVAQWRLASIPRRLSADQLRRFLALPDRMTQIGRRNYAIFLLLARLGLRATEVVRLTLRDLNWDAQSIRISAKGGGRCQMPLLPELADAIADYLRNGRPRSVSRRVFLRSCAPFRGFLDGTSVSTIVNKHLRSIGIDGPRSGAHVLRHTLATDLLRRGTSLTRIGQVLRHQHPDTTRIYAKVDSEALRARSLAWPETTP